MKTTSENLAARYSQQAPNRNSETLRSLLAAIMVADKKLHKNELDEILAAMNQFESHQDKDGRLTRNWLKDNIREIDQLMHGPNRERWLALQFLKLRDYPQKDEALDRLWRVAIADGELHEKEIDIVDKALWLWRR